ncbi:MAG: hypothetical protein ACQET1_06645 [Gemmatimonadota bacterium]
MKTTHEKIPPMDVRRQAANDCPPRKRGRWLLLPLLLLPFSVGCEDDFFTIRWEESPDTVLLYSLARPELNLYSGFDFLSRSGVRIESPSAVGEWDMALDTRDGDLVFLPPGAVGMESSTASIAPMGDMAYEDLKKAPRDTTLYVRDRPVPVNIGELYVIRSRQKAGAYGSRCNYYGKFVPISKDLEGQTVRLFFDISPVCNDRKLIPPKD